MRRSVAIGPTHWRVKAALFAAACIVFAALSPASAAPPTAQQLDFFEKRIRPILADHCFKCHGPSKQESDLRLDHISLMVTGGARGPAIVPGDPAASRLIKAVGYMDPDLQMPPRDKLSDEQIALLTQWVAMGAPWPNEPVAQATTTVEAFDLAKRKREHWAWQPLRSAPPPTVKNRAWVRDPLDAFILAKLEEKGLSPAAPAEKRDLIRRVYFDLIGLPPSPEQVEAFVNDRSADAFEKVVDELLASPHFGEKWARHWMDLVRYAETYGHEFDYPIPEAWRYRDYLIRAFNADVPYDLFLAEHIAGDLLDRPRMHPTEGYNESIIGTGFWFLHQATHAPVDVRMDTAERVDNQIDVMSKTFLGVTVACARCHDHKFDAISQADFYALAGVLQSSRQQLALLDPQGNIASAATRMRSEIARGNDTLARALPKPGDRNVQQIARYLLATREVLHGEPKAGDARYSDESEPIVIDDFESGTLNKWTADGRAFARTSTGSEDRQQPVTGFQGRHLINSYLDGDRPTGRLTSQSFTIERPHIELLVGGGAHEGKTCVNLLVDGKVVRSATGRNSETLERVSWEVAEFAGKQGRIEIVDDHSGGWGHVLVDAIAQVSVPAGESGRRPVQAVAAEMKLDAEHLARWVRAVRATDANDLSDPLSAWVRLVMQDATLDQPAFARAQRQLLDACASPQRQRAASEGSRVYASFDGDDYEGWYVTGEAFGASPTRAGRWDAASGGAGLLQPGVAHSGATAGRLQGVLRSPKFTIEHDHVQYRMAGRGGQIRFIVENFQMDIYNPLLFEGMNVKVETDGRFVWHTHNVSRYKGMRAHIEIIDHGDGFVAVDEIRFSDAGQAPTAVSEAIAPIVEQGGSRDRLARAYQAATAQALSRWGKPSFTPRDDALLRALLAHELLPLTQEGAAALATHAKIIADLARATPYPMKVLAMADGSGVDEHLYIRGSPRSLGPVIPRRFLEALAGDHQPPISPNTSGRLQLVERMLDEANPLPPRVMVNRVWHHLFGVGIVPTTDDFGVLGQPPTHPQLLDHLANWYRYDAKWSTKALIRRLVLSNTYRMSSKPTDAKAEAADPNNELLHRMRIRRLTGEAIRDAILATSGRLDEKMFGPSVRVHLTPFMDGRGRPGESGPLDGAGRRSVYIEVRRNFLSPMMQAFDMPVPFTTIGKRTVSNVPAQALILMNDPFVVQQAELWAKHVLEDQAATPDERVRGMYLTALGRPPTAEQLNAALAFLQSQAKLHNVAGDNWKTHEKVWADLCHVMLNMKDFAFVN